MQGQYYIGNALYMSIPDSMFDQPDHCREVIYEHVYTHYKKTAAKDLTTREELPESHRQGEKVR